MLSDIEKNRYNRHIILDNVGLEGQQRLKNASVLVIGAGGLGCPVLLYLTAAGVGRIGIIDFDVVDESNLQRQVLFSFTDIGKNKALAAKNKLQALNQLIKIEAYPEKLTTKNALQLFNNYDVIVDGTDNFSTRYLVNDASVLTNKPLVYGAIYKFEGQVTVFNYKNGPTYRCLFPHPPKAENVPNCSEVGVLGVLPGLIGTQQANEVLKIILGIGTVLAGKMQIYNALAASFYSLTINKIEHEIEQVQANKANFEHYDYDFFCSTTKQTQNDVTIEVLKQWLKKEPIQLIDVRNEWEEPKINSAPVLAIPLDKIVENIAEIDKNIKTVVFCQHGMRSLKCISLLETQGFTNLINLKNGIANWID